MPLGESKRSCDDLILIGYAENCIRAGQSSGRQTKPINKIYTYKLNNLAPGLRSFCVNNITALLDIIYSYQKWFICTVDPSSDTTKVQENRFINFVVLD